MGKRVVIGTYVIKMHKIRKMGSKNEILYMTVWLYNETNLQIAYYNNSNAKSPI